MIRNLLVFGILLLLTAGLSSATVYFVDPTPANATNNFTYPITLNCTTTASAFETDGNTMEIDGTNYTAVSDGSSISYPIPYSDTIFNHTYSVKCFGNLTVGGVTAGNETREIPYYGCGYVNGNGTLLGDVSTTSYTCFTFLTNPDLTLDGAGYTVSGIGTFNSIAIGSYMNGITVKNVSVKDFGIGINVEGSSSGSTFTNLTIFNSTGGMTCGGGGNAGICLCTVGSHNISNSIIYGGANDGIYISGTNNNISNNTIYNNQNRGLYVDGNTGADGNIIINNIIYNNSVSQIRASGMMVTNRIYNNILNASVGQATTEDFSMPHDFTTWNTTKTLATNIIGGANVGGNWYSDYAGVDMNGDGLGEAPYSVPASGNIDYLPLTNTPAPILSWESPTPPNATNDFTYPIVLNFSSDQVMDDCLMEIDGVNQTGVVSGDSLSCSYVLSYPETIFNNSYDVIGFANISDVYYQTEAREIPYYGCGLVKGNMTLIGNVSIDGETCFTHLYNPDTITMDGAGYTITGNSTPEKSGIYFMAGYSTYKNFRITGFDYGIYTYDSGYNIITNNTLYGNLGAGINITTNAFNDNYTDNTIYGNGYGIWIYEDAPTSYHYIEGNEIFSNSIDGIFIHDDHDTITNNNIYDNDGYQIYSDLGNGMGQNLIYNNILNATGIQGVAYDNWGDNWNTTQTLATNIIGGDNIGGNWYSDYTGVDLYGDGIGDTPYMIEGGFASDSLPLTNTPPSANITLTINKPANTTYTLTNNTIFNVSCEGIYDSYEVQAVLTNGGPFIPIFVAEPVLNGSSVQTTMVLGNGSWAFLAACTNGTEADINGVFFGVNYSPPPPPTTNVLIIMILGVSAVLLAMYFMTQILDVGLDIGAIIALIVAGIIIITIAIPFLLGH